MSRSITLSVLTSPGKVRQQPHHRRGLEYRSLRQVLPLSTSPCRRLVAAQRGRVRALSSPRDARVLDVGCDFGDNTPRIAKRVGANSEAVGSGLRRKLRARGRGGAQAICSNARFSSPMRSGAPCVVRTIMPSRVSAPVLSNAGCGDAQYSRCAQVGRHLHADRVGAVAMSICGCTRRSPRERDRAGGRASTIRCAAGWSGHAGTVADLFIKRYGPAHRAYHALPSAKAAAFRDDLIDLYRGYIPPGATERYVGGANTSSRSRGGHDATSANLVRVDKDNEMTR